MDPTPTPPRTRSSTELTKKSFLLFLAGLIPVAPFTGYIIGLVLGLTADEAIKAVSFVLTPLVVLVGGILPWVLLKRQIDSAIAYSPSEAPEARLKRLLMLPQRILWFVWTVEWMVGVGSFCVAAIVWFDKPLYMLPVGAGVGLAVCTLIGVPLMLKLEELFLPETLDASMRAQRPTGAGLLWPRQRWFLPYTFLVFILSTLILCGSVVWTGLQAGQEALIDAFMTQGNVSAADIVREYGSLSFSKMFKQVSAVAGYLLIASVFNAWLFTQRQIRATQAVGESVAALAKGVAQRPEWVSTDEIGDVASSITAVLDRLSAVPVALSRSATALADAGRDLNSANERQGETLVRQAAALQESHVTAQEIRQTSNLAAQKAEEVLQVAQRAEAVGRVGEAAIGKSLEGLDDIRRVVEGVMEKMKRLEQRAAQIGNITATVKELADQSNMLALNAAIEAVRSGEHGRGFAVVAREIRTLADQSIRSTREIREVLDELRLAVDDAARMSAEGSERVRAGLEQVRTSGENMSELGDIVRESSSAVRQIAATVTQQNAGIAQIFEVLTQLSKTMDETVSQLDETKEATRALQDVSQEVGDVGRRFLVA